MSNDRLGQAFDADPFKRVGDLKRCFGCNQEVSRLQFFNDGVRALSVCNNCLTRAQCNPALVIKFVDWSQTCKFFKSTPKTAAGWLFSPYDAGLIEVALVSAMIRRESKKDLVDKLITLAGDAGDQLLLAECIEELNVHEEKQT